MSKPLFDSLYNGMERVLDLRGQQHALTVSNLANADTPGFKARYIDFEHALSEAVGSGDRLQLQTADARHLSAPGGAENPKILEVEAPLWSEDGNSVYSEREVARLNANALQYTAVSKGLSRKLALLRFAASDGRS